MAILLRPPPFVVIPRPRRILLLLLLFRSIPFYSTTSYLMLLAYIITILSYMQVSAYCLLKGFILQLWPINDWIGASISIASHTHSLVNKENKEMTQIVFLNDRPTSLVIGYETYCCDLY